MHSYEMVGCNEDLARECAAGKEAEREDSEADYNAWLDEIAESVTWCHECLFWRVDKSGGADLLALCELRNKHRIWFGNCDLGEKR